MNEPVTQLPQTTAPQPLTFETPDGLEAAMALVATQLARGETPARLEDRILATPGLRPYSEPLIALCGAIAHGRSAPDGLGDLGSALATIHAQAPDGAARAAALGQLARHNAVRAALAPSDVPGIRGFALGAMVSLAFTMVWVDGLRWSPAGYGVLYQLFEKLARNTVPAMFAITTGLLVTYGASATRWLQLVRRTMVALFGLPFRQHLRRLDAEAALLAAAAARVPAEAMPRWALKRASPERLAIAEAGEAQTALAKLEYDRALHRALTVRWFTEVLADMAQGGVLAFIVLILAAMVL